MRIHDVRLSAHWLWVAVMRHSVTLYANLGSRYNSTRAGGCVANTDIFGRRCLAMLLPRCSSSDTQVSCIWRQRETEFDFSNGSLAWARGRTPSVSSRPPRWSSRCESMHNTVNTCTHHWSTSCAPLMSGKYKKTRDSAQQRPNPLGYSQQSPVAASPSEARTVQEAGTVFERVRNPSHSI
jgi:hypothetical protein